MAWHFNHDLEYRILLLLISNLGSMNFKKYTEAGTYRVPRPPSPSTPRQALGQKRRGKMRRETMTDVFVLSRTREWERHLQNEKTLITVYCSTSNHVDI